MKKIKKFLVLILVFILCLSFSACDVTISSVDTLMRPPKLGGDNSLLQDAFEETFGNSEIISMKTPISGENRSSYLLVDLDYDGNDEALVFYSDHSVDEMARVAVFRKVSEKWELLSDIKGQGEDIYEVIFADFNGDGIEEIVLCWSDTMTSESSNSVLSSSSQRILTLYNYCDNDILLFDTEFFTRLFVDDFNNDNSDDILLVNINLMDTENRTNARILSFNNDYDVCRDVDIPLSGLLDVFNIATDTVTVDNNKHTRIFVDGIITETAAITEIIDIQHDNFSFSLPLYENNISEKPLTIRDSRISSTDIDNDGIVEIPTLEILPNGIQKNADNEKNIFLNLTVWSEFTDGKLQIDFKCILNTAYGYMFTFPDEWKDEITVVYDIDSAVLEFYTVSDSKTDNLLLKIKAFSELKWDNEHGEYKVLSTSGALIYGYCYFDNTYITADNVINYFLILN